MERVIWLFSNFRRAATRPIMFKRRRGISHKSCCELLLVRPLLEPGQQAEARKCLRSTLLQCNQQQRGGNMNINFPVSQVRLAQWHIALTILIGTRAQD
jgi:hypothetical protein